MKIKKEIIKAFKQVGLSAEVQDDYINIARADGVHCEFYGQQGDDYVFASATYTLDGEEQDLDFDLPNELSEFVNVVQKILES